MTITTPRSTRLSVDLIIFDLDGTLVDSRQDIVNAVNAALRTLGLPERSFDDIVSFIGNGLSSLLRQSLGSQNQDRFDEYRRVFLESYSDYLVAGTALYPGARAVLEHFKDKQLFVLSNRTTPMAQTTIDALDIAQYFSGVYGADHETMLKPSPVTINAILGRTNVLPERCVMVGDMDVDVMAGKRAGVRTCAACYGLGRPEDLKIQQPDYCIDSIKTLPSLFE